MKTNLEQYKNTASIKTVSLHSIHKNRNMDSISHHSIYLEYYFRFGVEHRKKIYKIFNDYTNPFLFKSWMRNFLF